jgi:dolichol-phosphate mannosyltransferase
MWRFFIFKSCQIQYKINYIYRVFMKIRMNNPLKISVVFSVYNETESLPALFNEIALLEKPAGPSYEWIFVDDGSTDNSLELLQNFCTTGSSTGNVSRYLSFSRNFGHEAAMTAGIDAATGDAVICMDADLQHPPSLIPEMTETFLRGHEIITMVRARKEGVNRLNSYFSGLFYRIMNRVSSHHLAENASDFFLISKEVADVLRKNYRERNRFLRGIIQTMGFRSTSMEYVAPARIAGTSKYSFLRLISLTSNAFTSFSKAPLSLGIWFGFIFALISLILGIYTLWTYFFGTTPPSGYTTIVLFISLSFSILFFLIGIIGIYVGYLFDEQKNRPLYIVKEQGKSGTQQ